jgi:hypothetical protein
VVALAFTVLSRWKGEAVVASFDYDLSRATEMRPSADVFRVVDVALNGESRRAIYVTTQSRLIFTESIPEHGWLDVALGVREEAWTRDNTGVLFMIGVSAAGKYEELISLIVNPFHNPADRQWLPIKLDMSPWAGQDVQLIFNTRVSHPGGTEQPHLALWGEPRLVTR